VERWSIGGGRMEKKNQEINCKTDVAIRPTKNTKEREQSRKDGYDIKLFNRNNLGMEILF